MTITARWLAPGLRSSELTIDLIHCHHIMPATRTSSRQKATEVTSNPSLTHSPRSATHSSLSMRKKDTLPRSKSVLLGEVIEISSDDDEPVPRADSVVVNLRRQVKKLKEVCCYYPFLRGQLFDCLETKENSRLKAELATSNGELYSAKKELSELKMSSGNGKGKLVRLRNCRQIDWPLKDADSTHFNSMMI